MTKETTRCPVRMGVAIVLASLVLLSGATASAARMARESGSHASYISFGEEHWDGRWKVRTYVRSLSRSRLVCKIKAKIVAKKEDAITITLETSTTVRIPARSKVLATFNFRGSFDRGFRSDRVVAYEAECKLSKKV